MGRRPSFLFCACHNQPVEITAFGETCFRFKGREGVVVADAFAPIVGPTGRGLTADIVTFSRDDSGPTLGLGKGARGGGKRERPGRLDGRRRVPTSLESAFVLDSPGEYEVHGVLINALPTFRDDEKGALRGTNVCFVYELDGLQAIHLGDIGHLLDEDTLGEVGTVAVACVPIGGALPGARAAELVAQLDAKLIVPMPLDADGKGASELERFLHEMSVQHSAPVAKLSVTISSLPQETTVVLLEVRGRG